MLIGKQDNALRLQALDEAAEALGLEIGLPLAAARARVPDFTAIEADQAADQALLFAIGQACRRYTPALALDPPDGVTLDITGAARLFGGEPHLIKDLGERMRRQGLTAHLGAARSAGLAWALSRYRDRAGVTSIRDLPVEALRLDPQSLAVLNRLGLRQVRQILALPRPALAKRLGAGLLDRLDEILGLRAAALPIVPEPLTYSVQHKLIEPIFVEAQILALCRWLAGRLQERLERRGLGGRFFTLDLFRVDGAARRLEVHTSQPVRDPVRLTALFCERMQALDEDLVADYGFDLLRLTAEVVEPVHLVTKDFLGERDDKDFTALIDRLSVRLGHDAIGRLEPAPESRIPERAVRSLPFAAKTSNRWENETPAMYALAPLRPFTLFPRPHPIEVIAGVPEDPPKLFNWRRVTHAIVRAEGPERIAKEWWRDEEAGRQDDSPASSYEAFRDYYRIEDDKGRRFWVFRDGALGAHSPPRWFLHGVFP